MHNSVDAMVALFQAGFAKSCQICAKADAILASASWMTKQKGALQGEIETVLNVVGWGPEVPG